MFNRHDGWAWSDMCPGAGEPDGTLPFDGREHLQPAAGAPAEPPAGDSGASGAIAEGLATELDAKLIGEW